MSTTNQNGLLGQRALVTGATSGIGRAVARRLAGRTPEPRGRRKGSPSGAIRQCGHSFLFLILFPGRHALDGSAEGGGQLVRQLRHLRGHRDIVTGRVARRPGGGS